MRTVKPRISVIIGEMIHFVISPMIAEILGFNVRMVKVLSFCSCLQLSRIKDKH
jgi:hypothetical protein